MAKRPNIKKHPNYADHSGYYRGTVGYPRADYYSKVFYAIFKLADVRPGRDWSLHGVESEGFKWGARLEHAGAGFRYNFRQDYPESIVPDQFAAQSLDDVQAMLSHIKAELAKYHNR